MISIVTGISIFGVALGVAALIIVLAVMTGFEEDLRSKILGTNAHIVIVPFDAKDPIDDYPDVLKEVSNVQGISKASAFIYNKVMVSHKNRADGIVLKGIDPTKSVAVDLKKYMINGELSDLEPVGSTQSRLSSPEARRSGIILGVELAAYLNVNIGDAIAVLSSSTYLSPMGLIPVSRSFRVVGFCQSGMYEYDRTMAYISIASAQRLLGMKNGVNGIEVSVDDIFQTQVLVKELRSLFNGRFWIRDWKDMNRTFFSALKLEKIAMFIILTLIVFVAAFNIISSLTMMVMEKHKDIGILKAMGASISDIRTIFLTQGLIIGLVGTLLGLTVGTGISWLADTYQLIRLEGEVYYINYLPFQLRWGDILAVCAASLVISFLATIYPAVQAARLDPVEAIRYE